MSDLRKTIRKFVTTRGTLVWDEASRQFITVEREGYWYDGEWALAHDVAPVWEAEDFQFFNDDGSITTATSIAAENVAVVKADGIKPGDAVQLKVNVGETAGAAGTGEHTAGWTLQFKKGAGAWTTVGAATDVQYFDSANLVDTTVVALADYALTWGSGGTQRDWGDECEDGVSSGHAGNIWSNDFCEICFSIKFDATNTAEDDVITFRMLAPDGTSFITFGSVPTITMASAITHDFAATLTPTLALAADLDAIGELAATEALALSLAADLDAPGKLESAPNLALSLAADVDAPAIVTLGVATPRARWLEQPPAGTRLDQSHPLYPHLVNVWVCNAGSGVPENLVQRHGGKSGLVLTNNGMTWGADEHGGFMHAATGPDRLETTETVLASTDWPLGAFIVGLKPTTFTDLVNYRYLGNDDNFECRFDGSTGHPLEAELLSNATGGGANLVVVDEYFVVGAGWRSNGAGSTVVRTYFNGNFIFQSVVAEATTVARNLSLMTRTDSTTNGFIGNLYFCYQFDKNLKDTEERELGLDPWQLFEPPYRHPLLIGSVAVDKDIVATLALTLAVAADLDATGNISAAQSLALTAAADLDAQGSLDAALAIALTVAADLKASGNIAAATSLTLALAADLDADGRLDSTQALSLAVVADLDAPGKVAVATNLALAITADLDASGKLEAATALSLALTADLDADGYLAAVHPLVLSLAADLDASGKLELAENIAVILAANITDATAKDIEATLPFTLAVAADLDAAGELTSTQALSLALAADLDAAGSLASAQNLILSVAADLDAAGQLGIATSLTLALAADLAAVGKLEATHALALSMAPDVTSTVDVDIALATSVLLTVAADLDATGSLSSTQALILSITADLDAIGELAVAYPVILSMAADLDADGKLEASTSLALAVAADLQATGKIEEALTIALGLAADIDATGILNSTQALALSLAADLDAIGKVEAATTLVLALSAGITEGDPKDINATLALILSLAADLDATGSFTSAPDLTLSIIAGLTAAGKFELATNLALTVAADLDAQGKLESTHALALSLATDLKATGELTAATQVTLALAVDLDAAGRMDTSMAVLLVLAADVTNLIQAITASLQTSLTLLPALASAGTIDTTAGMSITLAADLQVQGASFLEGHIEITCATYGISIVLDIQGMYDVGIDTPLHPWPS